jgi:predicted helicase
MELREHQKTCINNISNHFESNDRGLIKMFCGSGKSFIIYHVLLEFGKKTSVVVVPSINLITQFNNDYLFDKQKILYSH